ncbi:hypothetical protein [Bifidobacterium parmae]|uniref:Uncharacterized protein n=1 Tax=Bifidobacterium parmae TaxID=361854 RepID=A0A2N5J6R8_9BIFI|nr:hypothetical protein [Bifidobacterium parmae]PLS29877.1 hypothetical protein Uis4E_0218 [Bifidobacterium parmae]
MPDSTTKLREIGDYHGYTLLFNPRNRRIIAERRTDLATALFDCEPLTLVRQWGCSDDDVRALTNHLGTIIHRQPVIS